VRILGLRFGEDCSQPRKRETLRYGHVMLMTDQVHDFLLTEVLGSANFSSLCFLKHFVIVFLFCFGFLFYFFSPFAEFQMGKNVFS